MNELLPSRKSIHRILEEMVTIFTVFALLGIVIVALLGIGIAESSGWIGANLLLGTFDPLLAGLSTEAAHIIDDSDKYYLSYDELLCPDNCLFPEV